MCIYSFFIRFIRFYYPFYSFFNIRYSFLLPILFVSYSFLKNEYYWYNTVNLYNNINLSTIYIFKIFGLFIFVCIFVYTCVHRILYSVKWVINYAKNNYLCKKHIIYGFYIFFLYTIIYNKFYNNNLIDKKNTNLKIFFFF